MRTLLVSAFLVLLALLLTKELSTECRDTTPRREAQASDVRIFSQVNLADEPCLVGGLVAQPGVLFGSRFYSALPAVMAGKGSLALLAIDPEGSSGPLEVLTVFGPNAHLARLEQLIREAPPDTTLALAACGPLTEPGTNNTALRTLLTQLGATQSPCSGPPVSWVLLTAKTHANTWIPRGEARRVGACIDLAASL